MIKVKVQTDYVHVIIDNTLSVLIKVIFFQNFEYFLNYKHPPVLVTRFVYKNSIQKMHMAHVVKDKCWFWLFPTLNSFSFYYSDLPVLETVEFQTIQNGFYVPT